MDGRKPLAKVEGRRRLRMSGVTVAFRGTPNLDDWVAYIANGTKSRKTILADHASERIVKTLMTRLQTRHQRLHCALRRVVGEDRRTMIRSVRDVPHAVVAIVRA